MLSRSILTPRVAYRYLSVNAMLAKQMPAEADRPIHKIDPKTYIKKPASLNYKTKTNLETSQDSNKEKFNELKNRKEMSLKNATSLETKKDDKSQVKKIIDDLLKNFNQMDKLMPLIKVIFYPYLAQ